MGLPASPPVSSDEGEREEDSPPPRSHITSLPQSLPAQPQPIIISQKPQLQPQKIPIQIVPQQQDQPSFNAQLITIDERTMQLHFTPLYFGKIDVIS